MIRSCSFTTILIFTFGCYALIITGGLTAPENLINATLDPIESLKNYSAVAKPADNVLDFLVLIEESATEIKNQIDIEARQNSNLLEKSNKNRLGGAGVNYFLFSASIVKESASKILSNAKDLRKKIALIETEKNLRSFAARLVARGNHTSVDNWLDSKADEIKVAIVNLTMQYSELSNSYQSHLSNLGVLNMRLAVDATYDLLGDYTANNDDDSTKEICRNGMFVCENGIRNITCVKYCNGYSECGDESDEPFACNNLFSRCPSGDYFRCDDGQCTSVSYRCSSSDYCRDRSHMDYCR